MPITVEFEAASDAWKHPSDGPVRLLRPVTVENLEVAYALLTGCKYRDLPVDDRRRLYSAALASERRCESVEHASGSGYHIRLSGGDRCGSET